MHVCLFYSISAALLSLAKALPNPAVNRIDVVASISHSIKSHHSTITSPPTAINTHASLAARNPAIGYLIDVVRPLPQSAPVPVPVSASLVSDACEPFITLEARNPAVNRIDAVRAHFVPTNTAFRLPCATINGSSFVLEAAERIEPRSLAVNRIDAVGQNPITQSVISLSGGDPVTVDANDIQELNAAATEEPTAVGTIPAISAIPTANIGLLPPLSSATALSTPVKFDVRDGRTTLYLNFHPDQVISNSALGHVLAEAMSSLRQQMTKWGKYTPLPANEWSYVRDKWDCTVICDANLDPGPGERKQILTYGTLYSTMAGLWGALFRQGNYFGASFDIYDREWGWVGSGTIKPWQKDL